MLLFELQLVFLFDSKAVIYSVVLFVVVCNEAVLQYGVRPEQQHAGAAPDSRHV